MSTVYLCSPTNSTFFTTCCHVAICDHEDKCPKCGEEVEPKGRQARWRYAYIPPMKGVV